MVVAAAFGGALVVAFVILVAVFAKTSHARCGHTNADGSAVMFGDGGSDSGCDSGSSGDGGCSDGGGGGGSD